LGPSQHDLRATGAQAPLCRPRSRECLLAGCERRFRPRCARSCYCSDACARAAREWSVRQAQRRYRTSEHGRARRREQCCRWRERQREKRRQQVWSGSSRSGAVAGEPGEGHQQKSSGEKIRCARPGCRATFVRSVRSPLKRFCRALCRRMLRRAWLRDARWRGVCSGCPLLALEWCIGRPRGP
jgi:hypothetical protein